MPSLLELMRRPCPSERYKCGGTALHLVHSLQSSRKVSQIKADAGDVNQRAEGAFVGQIAFRSFARVGRIKVRANGGKAEAKD